MTNADTGTGSRGDAKTDPRVDWALGIDVADTTPGPVSQLLHDTATATTTGNRAGNGRHDGSGTGQAEQVAVLLDTLAAYQHVDDPAVVWFVLAVAASSALDGEPLWGMPIGPSSGGKTEAIRLLDRCARRIDELTSASLLTWLSSKPPRPAGALVELGPRGILTVSDFSTVLATADRGGRDQLFANLRCVYDGSLTRLLGTAPHPLVWEGRMTLLAGCTAAIDRYAAHADALGPRWLAYRTPTRDSTSTRARARVAQRAIGAEQVQLRQAAATLAARIVRQAGQRARALQPDDLDAALLDHILDVAHVVCLGRASVPRHGYGRREIDGLPDIELPPRLTKQLTQLARCLVALGLDPQRTRWLVTHAGLSSMPQLRLRVLQALASGEELSVSEVARRAQAHRHPTRFALEELQAVGVTDSEDDQDDNDFPAEFPAEQRWCLAGPDAALVANVVAGHPWHEVWGAPP